tara:strand:- start:1568 stop:1768 length:201 start_codon:yes stop_codon:yes gene_type:complete
MGEIMKNIITNILGVIITAISIYGLLYLELEVMKFSVLILIGLSCFYFKNETIKIYIKKALDKWLK